MINMNFLHHRRIVAFDAICHHNPLGNLLQAVTTTAHEALRAVLPLDAEGCFAWANSSGPEAADAESERIFGLVETAGLSVRIL